jgi:hypothetical protein
VALHTSHDKNMSAEILQDANKWINKGIWKFTHLLGRPFSIVQYTSLEVWILNNDYRIFGSSKYLEKYKTGIKDASGYETSVSCLSRTSIQ